MRPETPSLSNRQLRAELSRNTFLYYFSHKTPFTTGSRIGDSRLRMRGRTLRSKQRYDLWQKITSCLTNIASLTNFRGHRGAECIRG